MKTGIKVLEILVALTTTNDCHLRSHTFNNLEWGPTTGKKNVLFIFPLCCCALPLWYVEEYSVLYFPDQVSPRKLLSSLNVEKPNNETDQDSSSANMLGHFMIYSTIAHNLLYNTSTVRVLYMLWCNHNIMHYYNFIGLYAKVHCETE